MPNPYSQTSFRYVFALYSRHRCVARTSVVRFVDSKFIPVASTRSSGAGRRKGSAASNSSAREACKPSASKAKVGAATAAAAAGVAGLAAAIDAAEEGGEAVDEVQKVVETATEAAAGFPTAGRREDDVRGRPSPMVPVVGGATDGSVLNLRRSP